jgi:hypothetical protein
MMLIAPGLKGQVVFPKMELNVCSQNVTDVTFLSLSTGLFAL